MGKNSARAKETAAMEKTKQNAANQIADIAKAKIDIKKQERLTEQKAIDASVKQKQIEASQTNTKTIAMYSILGLVVFGAMVAAIVYFKKKNK